MEWKEGLKHRKTRNKFLILVGGVILVFAAVFTLFLRLLLEKDRYVYKETKVEFGNVVLGIQESGSLLMKEEAIRYEIEIEQEESNEDEDEDEEEEQYLRIEEIYVAAGQDIKEGDSLIKFTDSSVKAVRRKLESSLTEAQANLVEAKKEYNVGVLSAKSTYDTNLLSSANLESVYQAQKVMASAGLRELEQKIVVLQGEIEELKKSLEDDEFWDSYEQAQKEYDVAKEEFEEVNQHSPAAYNAKYNAYTQAKSSFERLQQQVDDTNESIDSKQREILEVQEEIGFYQEQKQKDVLSAEHNKADAQADGEYAEAIYSYSVDSLEEAVIAAENTLEEAENKLEEFDLFVGKENTVVAAEAGKIVSIAYEADDEIVTIGDLLTYTTGKEDTITVNLAEEDVVDIQVGDSVSIAFSAYPQEEYAGIIKKIETKTSEDYTSTVNYPVTILVSGDTSKLYGGMAADITFAVETKEDVLYISKMALVEQEDETFVYMKNAFGQMELVPVKTGFSNGVSVEIKEGLQEGDTIYIASKVAAEQAGSIKDGSSNATEKKPSEGMDSEMPMDFDGEMPQGMDFEMPMDFEGGAPGGFGGGRPENFGGGMPGR